MRIEPEDMVVIVKPNGKATDLKFYIKATPANRKFVDDDKLKDSVLRAIAEDPKINGLIPEQKRMSFSFFFCVFLCVCVCVCVC